MASKLPGIRFVTEPYIPEEILPRMDIAAFAGFASSGPFHVPVPVEDMAGFRDIFGADLPLALDAASGEMQYALLSSAVESFFRNGGRRCWIIRVAFEQGAKYNHFPVPGLADVFDDGKIMQARVRARSEGSWSDTLMADAVLKSWPVVVKRYAFEDNVHTLDTYSEVAEGELLKLQASHSFLYLAIDSVKKISKSSGTFFRLKSSRGYWFTESPLFKPGREADVFVLSSDNAGFPGRITCPDKDKPYYRIELPVGPDRAPAAGSLLRIDIDRGSFFMTAAGIEMVDETSRKVIIKGKYAVYRVNGDLKPMVKWDETDPQGLLSNKLGFELIAYNGYEKIARIDKLAFVPTHSRSIGNLPTDRVLFSNAEHTILENEIIHPRFPFASAENKPSLCLPLGMPGFFDPEILTAAENNTESALERDGLSEFRADLFLDPDLIKTSSTSLLNEANFKCYQENLPLKGIHSLLPVEEVTIVAVPDAVLTGWTRKESGLRSLPLQPPSLKEPILSKDKDTYYINWSRTDEAESYTVQESLDASFGTVRRLHHHPARKRKEKIFLFRDVDCPHPVYFRVRAVRGKEVSSWSNTVHVIKPMTDFTGCSKGLIPPPVLRPLLQKDNSLVINWEKVEGGESYILQESKDPEFFSAICVYKGKETTFLLRRNDSSLNYYRVRAKGTAGYSPWSNTVNTEIPVTYSWVMKSPLEYDNDDLINIHCGLLRLCHARGDMFAVLALPLHFLDPDALGHKALLENYPGEENISSYGALYHPWFYSGIKGKSNPCPIIPPDGAVCGKISLISSAGAAWLAPANVAVEGALSLKPVIDMNGWERLYQAGINLIRHEPGGFMIMSASTLSKDPVLSLINVRRLLILLRRLSLREGAIYTFQPNDEDFRRLIHHRFEMLLGDMYRRGAFAGKTPGESFRVVTDGSVNTIQSIDQGRLIIELHVAPSFPMTFITVKLVQTGTYGIMVEEV